MPGWLRMREAQRQQELLLSHLRGESGLQRKPAGGDRGELLIQFYLGVGRKG